jgi:hypothetical protein
MKGAGTMKTVRLAVILLAVLAFAAAGCGKPSPTVTPATAPAQGEAPEGLAARAESTAASMAQEAQQPAAQTGEQGAAVETTAAPPVMVQST